MKSEVFQTFCSQEYLVRLHILVHNKTLALLFAWPGEFFWVVQRVVSWDLVECWNIYCLLLALTECLVFNRAQYLIYPFCLTPWEMMFVGLKMNYKCGLHWHFYIIFRYLIDHGSGISWNYMFQSSFSILVLNLFVVPKFYNKWFSSQCSMIHFLWYMQWNVLRSHVEEIDKAVSENS